MLPCLTFSFSVVALANTNTLVMDGCRIASLVTGENIGDLNIDESFGKESDSHDSDTDESDEDESKSNDAFEEKRRMHYGNAGMMLRWKPTDSDDEESEEEASSSND